MSLDAAADLTRKACVPCEGGVPTLTPDEVAALLPQVPGWRVADDGKRIRREWRARNFAAGMEFFREVAAVAEAENHHPDLHLVGYRDITIEVWTHAIGGLSENDFILAAKIDALPFGAKKG